MVHDNNSSSSNSSMNDSDSNSIMNDDYDNFYMIIIRKSIKTGNLFIGY